MAPLVRPITSTKNIMPVDLLVSRTWSIASRAVFTCGVEADRLIGAEDIVVDGASSDGHPALVLEGKGSAKAPITADHDKPVDSIRAHAVGGGGADQGIEELRATRSTDDRAATLDDVPHSPVVQFGELPNVAGKPVDAPQNPTQHPRPMAVRTTARMAAFIPGASPPLVRTPRCFIP